MTNPSETQSRSFTQNQAHDPLLRLQEGPNFIRDVINISKIILTPQQDDPFWQQGSCNTLSAAIMHVFYMGKTKSLHEVKRFILKGEVVIDENLHAHTQESLNGKGMIQGMLETSYPADEVNQFIQEFAHTFQFSERLIDDVLLALNSWQEVSVAQETSVTDEAEIPRQLGSAQITQQMSEEAIELAFQRSRLLQAQSNGQAFAENGGQNDAG